MKTFKLFCNPKEGVSYMLLKSMAREKLDVDYKNSENHYEEFLTHNIKTCPVLISFEDNQEVERIQSVQEIVNYLINEKSSN